MSALIALAGVLADQLLGEPPRWHPLVGFGRLAEKLEKRLNTPEATRFLGVVAVSIAVLPLLLLAWLLEAWWGPLVGLVLLYFALGARSLAQHARLVVARLEQGDLPGARERVGLMVSRESGEMDETAVTRATVESVLENGVDAVFGALFWFLVAGAPGVVLYRLVNTLDAMWGYRSDRFETFGWFAAKLDDLLNWIPARLAALSYAMMGNHALAMDCWRDQAHLFASPNGGPAMTAGAGALDVELGGRAVYHGEAVDKPLFGSGNRVVASDIHRALDLVHKSMFLWFVIAFSWSLLFA